MAPARFIQLRELRVSPLYLVTDPQLGGGPERVADIVSAAIAGGIGIVQLRDKTATDAELTDRAMAVAQVCGTAVPVFIDDNASVARRLGLGLHIGQGDMPYVEARRFMGDQALIGLSVEQPAHVEAVVAQCERAGVRLPDVVGIGPVTATATKPDAAAPLGVAGVEDIAELASRRGIASVAIGGIGVELAAALADTCVDGICVVSAIMAAPDPAAAARDLVAAFAGKPHQR